MSLLVQTSLAFCAPKVSYLKKVAPLLKKHCVKCHRAPYEKNGKIKNPKGGLRLDTPEMIMKGSEDGAVLVKGNPSKSPLYMRTTLDKDDDDVMPSRGELLSSKEIDLLRRWIVEGADFGTKIKVLKKKAENKSSDPFQKKLLKLSKGLEPLQIEQIHENIKIVSLDDENKCLKISIVSDPKSIGESDFAKLQPILAHIVILKMGKSSLGKKSFSKLKEMTRLMDLDLNSTSIRDEDLEALENLEYLERVNLFHTEISDKGLEHLAKIKNLQKLFLWETKVSKKGLRKLYLKNRHIQVSRSDP